MLSHVSDLVFGFFEKLEFGILHMNVLQWSIVAVVAVVVGFLMLKSQAI